MLSEATIQRRQAILAHRYGMSGRFFLCQMQTWNGILFLSFLHLLGVVFILTMFPVEFWAADLWAVTSRMMWITAGFTSLYGAVRSLNPRIFREALVHVFGVCCYTDRRPCCPSVCACSACTKASRMVAYAQEEVAFETRHPRAIQRAIASPVVTEAQTWGGTPRAMILHSITNRIQDNVAQVARSTQFPTPLVQIISSYAFFNATEAETPKKDSVEHSLVIVVEE